MSDIVAIMAALAEPTRLSAVEVLSGGGEHCVCKLMRELGVTQSRMSRHMAKLKSAGLVIDRRHATWVYYRLNPDMPQAVRCIVETAVSAFGTQGKQRNAA